MAPLKKVLVAVLFVFGGLIYWLHAFWPAVPSRMLFGQPSKCNNPFGDASTAVDLLPYADDGFRAKIKNAKGRNLISPAQFMEIARKGELEYTEHSKIPKVFHRTSKSRSRITESMFMEWITTWTQCNPDWLHVLWDDCDIRQLVVDKMPSFLDTFDAYPHQVGGPRQQFYGQLLIIRCLTCCL